MQKFNINSSFKVVQYELLELYLFWLEMATDVFYDQFDAIILWFLNYLHILGSISNLKTILIKHTFLECDIRNSQVSEGV